MLVQWKEPRALTLHRPSKAKATPHEILVPGFNEVEDSVWSELETQPGVKRLIENRKLRLKKPSRDNKKAGKGLVRFDQEEADDIIRETYSKKVLTAWRENEQRQKVLFAIDAQIKHIEESVRMRGSDDEVGPQYKGEQ